MDCDVKIELLPHGRWPELQRAFEESRSDEQLPKPENSIILGAFDGETLIGSIGAERCWVVSPLWVAQQHRGTGLAEGLALNLSTFNVENLREMCVTTSPHVERLVHSIGFIPIQGQMWRRDVK